MTSRNQQSGFSLLELMIVAGVLIIISTLIVPKFDSVPRILHKIRIEGASKMFSSDIRRIQSLSRLQGGVSDNYRLQINFNKNTYYIIKNSTIIKAISFEEAYPGINIYGRFSEIAFSANGAPSKNGSFKIYSDKYPEIFTMIDVLPVSGRVGVY